jgi:hypothetical protein
MLAGFAGYSGSQFKIVHSLYVRTYVRTCCNNTYYLQLVRNIAVQCNKPLCNILTRGVMWYFNKIFLTNS